MQLSCRHSADFPQHRTRHLMPHKRASTQTNCQAHRRDVHRCVAGIQHALLLCPSESSLELEIILVLCDISSGLQDFHYK